MGNPGGELEMTITLAPPPIRDTIGGDQALPQSWTEWFRSARDLLQSVASWLDTDPTLAANSDVKVASQKATKTYVDTNVLATSSYRVLATGPAYSPADSTTYYINGNYTDTIGSVAKRGPIYFVSPGSIKRAKITLVNLTTVGSNESSSFSIRINNLTDYLVSAVIKNDQTQVLFSNNSLNIAVVDGDYFEFKWVTPAWAVNPVGVWIRAELFVRS